MWLLNFLPSWVVYAALLLSVAGLVAAFVLSFIPFISKYSLPIKVFCTATLIGSVWLAGGISNQAAWEARVKEMELKVAKAEAKSAQANAKLNSKVIKKIENVRGKTNANVKAIKQVSKKIDSQCKLPNAAIVLHDSASQNVVPPSSGIADERASNVEASRLLETVTENYGQYYELREIVKGWQDWYKEQKKIFEEVK